MSKMRYWRETLSEDLPVDVLPVSNGEYAPGKPSREQLAVMELANSETERIRRKFGMSRRDFVRTSAAMAIGTWALGTVTNGKWGRYSIADARAIDACTLQHPDAQMNNLPGEFIFDVQSHHVDSDGEWRVTNPGFHAFFTAIWEQSGPLGGFPSFQGGDIQGWGSGREIDPIENLSRYHYLKELYLDSSTNMCVLSAVPSSPDSQPLPIDEAAITVGTVNGLAGNTPRCVMHAFVMPNRGSLGSTSDGLGRNPVFMREEFELMERNIQMYPTYIRGWKVYPAWGDVPYASGWYHDDPVGLALLEQIRYLGDKYNVPKVMATHKGFALPAFDQRAAAPRDIGPAAKAFPDVDIIVYHSGFDQETVTPYPGDDNVNSADRGIDSLIKSLRENAWDASRFVPPGLEHGNVPNVYAEIGSTWRITSARSGDQAAHMLGKLIQHVGPQRVVWGTDSLWYGSPQPEIIRLRNLQMSEATRLMYNLPYGLDGDRFDPRRNALHGSSYLSPHPAVADWPTDGRAHPERSIRNGIFGRNVAGAYRVDPDAAREAISCDQVQKIRDSYIVNEGTPTEIAPFASNQSIGRRTDAEVIADIFNNPWSP